MLEFYPSVFSPTFEFATAWPASAARKRGIGLACFGKRVGLSLRDCPNSLLADVRRCQVRTRSHTQGLASTGPRPARASCSTAARLAASFPAVVDSCRRFAGVVFSRVVIIVSVSASLTWTEGPTSSSFSMSMVTGGRFTGDGGGWIDTFVSSGSCAMFSTRIS